MLTRECIAFARAVIRTVLRTVAIRQRLDGRSWHRSCHYTTLLRPLALHALCAQSQRATILAAQGSCDGCGAVDRLALVMVGAGRRLCAAGAPRLLSAGSLPQDYTGSRGGRVHRVSLLAE